MSVEKEKEKTTASAKAAPESVPRLPDLDTPLKLQNHLLDSCTIHNPWIHHPAAWNMQMVHLHVLGQQCNQALQNYILAATSQKTDSYPPARPVSIRVLFSNRVQVHSTCKFFTDQMKQWLDSGKEREQDQKQKKHQQCTIDWKMVVHSRFASAELDIFPSSVDAVDAAPRFQATTAASSPACRILFQLMHHFVPSGHAPDMVVVTNLFPCSQHFIRDGLQPLLESVSFKAFGGRLMVFSTMPESSSFPAARISSVSIPDLQHAHELELVKSISALRPEISSFPSAIAQDG